LLHVELNENLSWENRNILVSMMRHFHSRPKGWKASEIKIIQFGNQNMPNGGWLFAKELEKFKVQLQTNSIAIPLHGLGVPLFKYYRTSEKNQDRKSQNKKLLFPEEKFDFFL